MKAFLFSLTLLSVLLPSGLSAAESHFDGRWQLVLDRSSALDGYTNMHLVLETNGETVDITHDMRWRTTKVVETNSVNTRKVVKIPNFFRIEQRHMAVYPPKDAVTPVSAEWLDEGRTLRVEALVPVEVSQGDASIRIYSEYRIGVGGDTLTLVELHSTRNNPLVYRFTKLPEGDSTRP
ncbi:MAG: hypothetical protein P8L44_15490 [Opitutales bacterium]|nr:hypothetical protein [Opitutales bacterium]